MATAEQLQLSVPSSSMSMMSTKQTEPLPDDNEADENGVAENVDIAPFTDVQPSEAASTNIAT